MIMAAHMALDSIGSVARDRWLRIRFRFRIRVRIEAQVDSPAPKQTLEAVGTALV